MDLCLGLAVVVVGAVVGNALLARAGNLLQLLEVGLGQLGKLAAGDVTVVGLW